MLLLNSSLISSAILLIELTWITLLIDLIEYRE